MHVKIGLVVAVMGLAGCATSGVGRGQPGFASASKDEIPSVHVGDMQVIDKHVNPLVPVRVTTEGSEIAVRFGRLGQSSTVERLDAASLQPRSREAGPREASSSPSTGVARVVLDGGRFLLCWTEGSVEWGHQAVAQMFRSSDGSPLGAPVVISRPDADVLGAPRAVTTDGRRVVATFAASSGQGAFDLVAVPLDQVTPGEASTLTARR